MKLLITYVVLLSIQVPFNIIYFWTLLSSGSESLMTAFGMGYPIIALLYFAALIVIGTISILNSFKAYKENDFEYCIKGFMILKYGLIPFFVVNFLSMAFLALVFLVASRGTIIFAAPIFLLIGISFTWIAMLPSSFWGLQVIRFAVRDGKIGKSKFLHIFLQFCFLLDLLDTVYLAAFKYRRGKVASILVYLAYVLCISFVAILLTSLI